MQRHTIEHTAPAIRKPKWQFDAASTYNDMGFSVIPLIGKRPAIPSWLEFTERRASTSQLREWFQSEECPFNIGIVCGKVSRIVVADLDTAEDATWWLSHHPDSPLMVHTGRSGGLHVYYRSRAQELGNRSKMFSRSIDLKSERGYVVAPPSVHPETGIEYAWSRPQVFENYSWDDIPPFDPAWLPKATESSDTKYDLGLGQLKVPRTQRTERRIEGILRLLDQEVEDRSKRDFGAVMMLLKLHVLPDEIAQLVEGRSKFQDNPQYLAKTIQNALKAMEHATTRTS